MKINNQFLFAPFIPREINSDKITKLGEYFLISDCKLNVSEAENGMMKCILVGDIYDYIKIEYSNFQVLQEICSNAKNFNVFLRSFEKYCGSFIVFFFDKTDKNIYIFSDATASREYFYYKTKENKIIAASQPIIISSVVHLENDNSEIAKDFYSSENFKKRMTFIGNQTNYQGVYRLKPNFILDVKKIKTKRYFPEMILQEMDLDSAALKASQMIKGFIIAAHRRHKIAIPVTGGWESRILLAASKEIKEEILYFVFKHNNYSENHPDIKIPKKLLKQLGLRLNVFEYPMSISLDKWLQVKKIISYPRKKVFYYLLNVIAKTASEYLILNGNISEICRMEWDDIIIENEHRIAFLQKYPFQKYALSYYKTWLTNNCNVFEKFNYRISDMLYWEENAANWVAKANSEMRIVAEVLQPFNSKELIKTLLSVDKKFRVKQNPRLYKKIIEKLWSECLSEPINPSFKKRIIRFMQIIGIYGYYRNCLMKFQLFLAKIKQYGNNI